MSRHARIEIHPATYRDSWNKVNRPARDDLPPAKRPHFLRLVAANGEILAHSETYSTRQNARRAVRAWRKAFLDVGFGRTRNEPDAIEFDYDERQRP